MSLTNRAYDVIKWIAQYLLPAIGTLYFALARIWNLPYATEIVGTITAIDTFLGVVLGISSASYSGDGTLTVDTSNPEKDVYNLELDIPVEDLPNLDTVTFKVDAQK